jgi:hypothetical protein
LVVPSQPVDVQRAIYKRKECASRLYFEIPAASPLAIAPTQRLGGLASSIGSLLYKVLIILSTGLLALQPTNVRHGKVAMTVRNQFNGTDAETRLATIADLPLYINHGAQNLGLSYPHGTNERYAIQSFDANDFPGKGVTTTAQVDAFEADFGCQMADLHMVE